MTEAEWLASNDAPQLIKVLRQVYRADRKYFERQMHRYYLACCRAIWKLLPQDASRQGVEVAERYLRGQATDEELREVDWHVEGAAFNIDYNCDPEAVERWVEQTPAIPESELRAIIHPPEAIADISTQELLKRAAYFADYAVIYPHLTTKRNPPDSYLPFLSASLLREVLSNPFRAGLGYRA
jgi:hypothetical protein